MILCIVPLKSTILRPSVLYKHKKARELGKTRCVKIGQPRISRDLASWHVPRPCLIRCQSNTRGRAWSTCRARVDGWKGWRTKPTSNSIRLGTIPQLNIHHSGVCCEFRRKASSSHCSGVGEWRRLKNTVFRVRLKAARSVDLSIKSEHIEIFS